MNSRIRRWLLVVGTIIALPALAHAQEASVNGIVTDSTGGVLPGVTITALHQATGNTFVAVTDERGAYRLPVRIGAYRITAELPGFATVARTIELLVGQEASLNLQMAPSALQESVTVTGEAPLVNTASSSLGSAVDSRQMEALPVNGRNWIDLAMLAPGNRNNAVAEAPITGSPQFSRVTSFQLNVDGQQVTNVLTGGGDFGQPRYSRDAIAEFEFVANRFDATQGRSMGVQVNAITKSGTNTPAGTLGGYFRDDRFNAADFIQHRVLPYSDQQLSATFGGPIRKDRIHFFANYEYEREPQTYTYSSPYPNFNIDQSGSRQEKKAGGRFDFQFSPLTHLSVRANLWSNLQPYDSRYSGGANRHPSGALVTNRHMRQVFSDISHVVSNRAVNDLKIGYAGFGWYTNPVIHVDGAVAPPSILLRGYTVGLNYTLTPQTLSQDVWSFRDDFSYSYTLRGRHDMKVGGEVLPQNWNIYWCNICTGVIDATGGPIPANIQDLVPVWDKPSTWNLAALSPITTQYRIGVGNFSFSNPWRIYAGWVQDDWKIGSKLTLNLGARYDLMKGAFGETLPITILPFVPAERHIEKNDVSPRLGAVYALDDRTVVRGGFGKYYTQPANSFVHFLSNYGQQVIAPVFNDGRPDFAANPFNGPIPSYDQTLANACDVNNSKAGCFRRELRMFLLPSGRMPYSYQTSVGIQRQFSSTAAMSADFVITAGRHDAFQQNINLSYDPVTGVNNPFTDISKRPYPAWGVVGPWTTEGYSNLRSLQTEITKRFSHRWQASGTYMLAGFWDGTPQPIDFFRDGCQYVTTLVPGRGFVCDVPVKVPKDLGGEYGLGVSDQRHRATINGIWEMGYGVQLSGLYFFGSGVRQATTYGGDLRNTGGSGETRLRPDGSIVSRNNFVGRPIHRIDMRLQRSFKVGGHTRLDGMVEVFNLLNHENYGSYVTTESARNYGAPSAVQNVAYYPRTLQLGFHVAF
jgi:hypothetical protein